MSEGRRWSDMVGGWDLSVRRVSLGLDAADREWAALPRTERSQYGVDADWCPLNGAYREFLCARLAVLLNSEFSNGCLAGEAEKEEVAAFHRETVAEFPR